MCNHISEAIANNECSNFYIKLLMLTSGNDEFTLLYGFCVPTKQPVYEWKIRKTTKQKSIWSAVLPKKETMNFANKLTTNNQIVIGSKKYISSELIKRPVVLSNDGQNKTSGPVSDFCRVTEYWNTDKNALYKKIQASLGSSGKELYQHILSLWKWTKEECGIDFSKDTMRIGNFEIYDLQLGEDAFEIKIHKDLGLKKTTISKKTPFLQDLIINCIAEHHSRSIINQTKLFRVNDSYIDFMAEEPMSRVIVQIWEADSGNLIFSKDIPLIMRVSFDVNIGSPTYKIRDPWVNKLFASAANRSDIIKAQIESVSKSTYTQTSMIKSNTYDDIDKAIEDAGALFSGYQQSRTKGAFIANIQKDGEINSFLKIREYIEIPSVKRVLIADPYFSVISAQKMLTRIPRTDIQIDIITSLTDTDPDTNNKINICEKYREFLTDNKSILHNNLSITNLTRGKDPVFHDRYLIRFFDDGKIDGFLLSNSFNSMGQFYPFVISPMEQVVCYEVCDYLNDLCDPKVQSQRSAKDRIISELLCDFHNGHRPKFSVESEYLPLDLWLGLWCSSGTQLNIPKEELVSAVNTLWAHWEEDKTLTCKILSHLALTNHLWSVKDLEATIKSIDSAEINFINEFVKIAKEKELQQNHILEGINSSVYIRAALLNGQSKPSRQGFSKIFDETGHVWYSGDNWLKGGYTLLLCLAPSTFIELLDEIKSPLMLDVLSTQMLFYCWDEILFNTAAHSNNLCVKLLCGEYVFHQLQENKLNVIQIEEIMKKLSLEDSSLQLSYLLSKLAFHIRTTRSIKLSEDEINSLYVWMLKKLAANLSQCSEEIQRLALYWLHDCEIQSKCKLYMDLASMDCDSDIKTKLYNEVIKFIEYDLVKTPYTRDITNLVNMYLQAIDALYGDNSEQQLLKRIVDWRVFETATEPALKYYDYSKWSSANVRALWQMCILNEYILRHPSSKEAEEWLEYWEPRLMIE